MAVETCCQTPGAVYSFRITARTVEATVALPPEVAIPEDDAELLEANLHNVLEVVLARYWEAVDWETVQHARAENGDQGA